MKRSKMKKSDKGFKTFVIGDGAVGKTSLIMTYVNGIFPEIYVPTVWQDTGTDITDGETVYKAFVLDAAGGEDFYRLRPLLYRGTDVLILCFALDNRHSYENITTEWLPELKQHRPKTPIVLVGTKSDLEAKVTTDEGQKLQSNINAYVYLECSSKQGIGVKAVFDSALAAYKDHQRPPKTKKCAVM